MKTISIAAFATIAALATTTATAEVPSYTFAELSYSGGNVEGPNSPGDIDQDTSGYKAKGSFGFAEEYYVSGSYLFTDRNGFDYADVKSWQANAGFIREISDTSTFDVSAVYRRDEIKGRTVVATIENDFAQRQTYKGVGINFAVRNNVTDWLELYGRGGYLWGEWEGALTFDAGATWNITDLLGVFVAFEYVNVDDEGNDYELSQLQLGGRVSF